MSYWLEFVLEQWHAPEAMLAFLMLLVLARRAERENPPAPSVNELQAKFDGMHIDLPAPPTLELHTLPAELLLLIADAVIPAAARHGTWRPVDLSAEPLGRSRYTAQP